MSRLTKSLSLGALALLGSTLAAPSVMAQTRQDANILEQTQRTQDSAPRNGPSRLPDLRPSAFQHEQRFTVEAIGFTAVDESGFDFAGSDEVYSTWSSGSSYVGTQVFGNIDSGNYRDYHELQSCVLPLAPHSFINGRANEGWRCVPGGAAGPIGFNVNLYEDDGISFPVCFSGGIAPAPECEDDWLGGYRGSWTTAELVAMLPKVGSSQRFTVRLIACPRGQVCGVGWLDADYDFHFSITRLDDVEVTMKAAMSR